MYNRYIRNDNGSYTRVPQEEAPQAPSVGRQDPPAKHQAPPPEQQTEVKTTSGGQPSGGTLPFSLPSAAAGLGGITDGLTGFLRHVLDQLHLDHVDTGDLLLLGLLFFLFREDADEELLVSLGLLLIL